MALAALAHFLLGLGQVDVQAQVGATHDVQNVAANRLGGQVLRMDVVVDANASVAAPCQSRTRASIWAQMGYSA